tara:strand:- start:61 stop:507 length:447 start_codon:yes stop_codon:yes gene_type:complete
MKIPSHGNSRNRKVLSSFSSDFQYYDWWNYLDKKEIYLLDFFFKNFFQIFKNKPNRHYKKINVILLTQIILNHFKEDYLIFLDREIKIQKQFNLSSLSSFSYYRFFRTPLKLFFYTAIYPLIFLNKIWKIQKLNYKYRSSKIKLKIFK